jgi:hypothetical protein
MKIGELLSAYSPESWGRGEDWVQHASRLWSEEGDYMAALLHAMVLAEGWIQGPVTTDDGVVQDGHHRLVIEAYLDRDTDIPVSSLID